MKKNYLKFLPLLVMMCCISVCFSACSSDDDIDNESGGNLKSTLTVDGKSVEITALEAEYDDGVFAFWVNDAMTTDKRPYIQAEFASKENIDAGTDITAKFEILFQRNKGNEYFMSSEYKSGNIIVKEVDNNKHFLTIQFKEATYQSNLKNKIIIDGVVKMNYTVVQYGK